MYTKSETGTGVKEEEDRGNSIPSELTYVVTKSMVGLILWLLPRVLASSIYTSLIPYIARNLAADPSGFLIITNIIIIILSAFLSTLFVSQANFI